jgi:hypothetical protein
MPSPDAVAEVARSWLRRAHSDLVTARRALADRDLIDLPDPETLAGISRFAVA